MELRQRSGGIGRLATEGGGSRETRVAEEGRKRGGRGGEAEKGQRVEQTASRGAGDTTTAVCLARGVVTATGGKSQEKTRLGTGSHGREARRQSNATSAHRLYSTEQDSTYTVQCACMYNGLECIAAGTKIFRRLQHAHERFKSRKLSMQLCKHAMKLLKYFDHESCWKWRPTCVLCTSRPSSAAAAPLRLLRYSQGGSH